MEQSIMGESAREVIKSKLRQTFDGETAEADDDQSYVFYEPFIHFIFLNLPMP
jgi:hypothetical protein